MNTKASSFFYVLAALLFASWVFLPNYFGGYVSGTKHLYEFVILIVFVTIGLVKPGRVIYVFTNDILAISVLIAIIFGVVGGMTQSNPVGEIRQVGTHMVFHLMLYTSIVSASFDILTRSKIFKLLLLSVAFMTFLTLMSYFFPSNSYIEYLRQDPDRAYRYADRLEAGRARFLGIFPNSVFTATNGGYTALLGVALYRAGHLYGSSMMKRLFATTLVVLGSLFTFLTLSRGPYIFLAMTMAVFWIFSGQISVLNYKFILKLIMLAFGLFVAYEYLQWMIDQRGGEDAVSSNIRLIIWSTAVNLIYSFDAKELVFGAGYLKLSAESGFRHAHNLYLNSLLVAGPVVAMTVTTALIVRLRSIHKLFNAPMYSKILSARRSDKAILYSSILMTLFFFLTGVTSVGPTRDIRTITPLVVIFGMASSILLNYKPITLASKLNKQEYDSEIKI